MRGIVADWVLGFLDMLGIQEEAALEVMSYIDTYTIVVFSVLFMIVGVLQCFHGSETFNVWCSFVGMLIGVICGLALSALLIPADMEFSWILGIVFIVCLGILGYVIAHRAKAVNVFLYAFVTPYAICYFAISISGGHDILAVLAGLLVGVGGGVAAFAFKRLTIISSTTLVGGVCVALGLMILLEDTHVVLAVIIPIIVGLSCTGGGFYAQYKDPPPEIPEPGEKTAEASGAN